MKGNEITYYDTDDCDGVGYVERSEVYIDPADARRTHRIKLTKEDLDMLREGYVLDIDMGLGDYRALIVLDESDNEVQR